MDNNNPNHLVIRINSDFYNLDAVSESLKDFNLLDQSSVSEEGKEIIIKLSPMNEIPNLKEELCNYILGLMKNNFVV